MTTSGLVAITYTNAEPATDAHEVLSYVRQNAAALGLDENRIGLWACSGSVPTALSLLMQGGRDYLKLSPRRRFRLNRNLTPRVCVVHICGTQRITMGVDRDRRTIDDRLPLRPVEFHILLSLAAGERHGYGIIQDIQDRGDAPVPDVGTMYRALARMVEAGLIRAAARRPAPDASDERRNYYRITEAGHLVAIAEARRLEALTRAARLGGLLPKAAQS